MGKGLKANMWSLKTFIVCYLDTNLIPRSKGIENPTKEIQFLLKELFQLSREDKITLRTAQGSHEDIFGSNNEKINDQAVERSTFMQLFTEPVAETILESNEDFSEDDIELFNIMFSNDNKIATSETIFTHFWELSNNDKNDFRIIKSCIEDSNNYAFFLSLDKKAFIKGDKKEKLEQFVSSKKRVSLTIGELDPEMLDKVHEAIKDISTFLP